MKPRERAGAVWDRFSLDKFTIGREAVSIKEIIDAYERAIIAAVEEEREACKQLALDVERQSASLHNAVQHQEERFYYEGRGMGASTIAARIERRGRS